MTFQLQKISDYGTATPAVARTLVQGNQLMQAFPIGEEVRSEVNEVLFEVQRQLVRCVQVWERVRDEVGRAKALVAERGLDVQSNRGAVSLPSVADLMAHAESFLQAVKLAIRDVGRLLRPFFGTDFGHRFDRALAWARGRFEEGDHLVQCFAHYEPWVDEIVALRNAVDHPTDLSRGKLVVYNFRLVPSRNGPQLAEPAWCLSGDDPTPMLDDMQTITEGVLRISEDVLSICLLKNRGAFPLYIYEIPEANRDPKCPIRLRVGLNLPKAVT
jgi:hypothetical protein